MVRHLMISSAVWMLEALQSGLQRMPMIGEIYLDFLEYCCKIKAVKL